MLYGTNKPQRGDFWFGFLMASLGPPKCASTSKQANKTLLDGPGMFKSVENASLSYILS